MSLSLNKTLLCWIYVFDNSNNNNNSASSRIQAHTHAHTTNDMQSSSPRQALSPCNKDPNLMWKSKHAGAFVELGQITELR